MDYSNGVGEKLNLWVLNPQIPESPLFYQHRSLEDQHGDFRGSRWIEQLDADLLTGRSLIISDP